MESQLVLPEGFFRDDEMGTEEFIHYPSVKVIKTTGKAICDERDEDKFSLTLAHGLAISTESLFCGFVIYFSVKI